MEQRKLADAYVFHHEFLYLVCNTQSRIEQINYDLTKNLRGEIYKIHLRELDNSMYQTEVNAMTHIHLLAKDFRDDKTPNMLI